MFMCDCVFFIRDSMCSCVIVCSLSGIVCVHVFMCDCVFFIRDSMCSCVIVCSLMAA